MNDITNDDFVGNLEPQLEPLSRGTRVVRPSERLQALREWAVCFILCSLIRYVDQRKRTRRR